MQGKIAHNKRTRHGNKSELATIAREKEYTLINCILEDGRLRELSIISRGTP
jgi:hypothetical protein